VSRQPVAGGGGESVLEVGVAAEVLIANLAEVDVLREQHGDVKLHEIVATVALGSFRGCSWAEAGVGEERLR
jgi:hypothetical protein